MFKSFYILLFSFLSIPFISSQNCNNLPDELPQLPSDIEAQNLIIAQCYAPNIFHLAEHTLVNSANGRADLITAVNYDNNWNTGDNWEKLEDYDENNPDTHDELDPLVYYSVVWTDIAWVITYGFYHPRDYGGNEDCCCTGCGLFDGENHENDFEGAILVVSRIDTESGINENQVVGGYSISHNDLIKYRDISEVPEVFIDNRTHAVELNLGPFDEIKTSGNPCDDGESFNSFNSIFYTLSDDNNASVWATESTNSPGFLFGFGSYLLEDIFTSSTQGLWYQRGNPNVFSGSYSNEFHAAGTGGCVEYGGKASAPWGWGQLDYSNDMIKSMVCESMFGGFGQFTCLETPPMVLHNPYIELDCGIPPASYVITEDTDFNALYNINFDRITIMPNTTLTINNSQIPFVETGYIDVRPGGNLIVDNSTLKSCNQGSWQGISSSNNFGGSNGNITIRNNSIIRDADVAITMGKAQIWSQSNLSVSNSKIMWNNIGISFGFGIAISTIENSEFIQNYKSDIMLKGSRGLKITNSIFKQYSSAIDQTSIHSLNSVFKFQDGCLIDNGTIGITMFGTYPFASGSNIGNSNTTSNKIQAIFGIVGAGNTYPSGLRITNNLFNDYPSSGAYIVGENKATIINNNFEYIRGEGIYIQNTGANFNDFNCNEFKHNTITGIQSESDNNNTVFLGNSFENPNLTYYTGDVTLKNSTLNSSIGTEGNPAENCFSEIGKDIIEITQGQSFTYNYYRIGQTCEEPDDGNGFLKEGSIFEPINCLSYGIFNLIDPDGDESLGIDPDSIDYNSICKPCVIDSINQWIINVVGSGGEDPRILDIQNELVETELNFMNEKILDQWINFGIYLALSTGDFTYAENILQPLKKWKWQTSLYGIKMLQRDYNAAQLVLDSLPSRNLNEQYFKTIQNVNIIFHNDPGHTDTIITQADLDLLELIGLSDFPVKGYAASLYYQITGINLYPTNLVTEYSRPRSSANEDSQSLSKVSIIPNPALSNINIELDNHKIRNIEIYSISGNLMFSRKVENTDIDVSNFSDGLYIVIVYSNNGERYISKFIKQ